MLVKNDTEYAHLTEDMRADLDSLCTHLKREKWLRCMLILTSLYGQCAAEQSMWLDVKAKGMTKKEYKKSKIELKESLREINLI